MGGGFDFFRSTASLTAWTAFVGCSVPNILLLWVGCGTMAAPTGAVQRVSLWSLILVRYCAAA